MKIEMEVDGPSKVWSCYEVIKSTNRRKQQDKMAIRIQTKRQNGICMEIVNAEEGVEEIICDLIMQISRRKIMSE